jgi:molybdenum cofactor cytidylyltransferase
LRAPHVEARPPATGRVNLHAAEAGVLRIDKAIIDAINRVDPAITVATLPPYAALEAGQMVATVKIIPFAVHETLLERVEAICASGEAFSVRPFVPRRVGLIQTVLPGVKASVLDKTARITEARLARSVSRITGELRPPHEEESVTSAILAQAEESDMLLIFGASAVCDEDDVVPAAIRRAGGNVSRVGMPVDPGNLLVLGSLKGKPVLGVPGCARSPKLNGFDWVIDRLIAGVEVTPEDIAGMGVGGLLMEIPTRPQPRDIAAAPVGSAEVWAVLLAAGQSRRMGPRNKLLAVFDGKPLVRRTAEQVAASRAAGTVAVLGHEAERVAAALEGLDLRRVCNADFATGLASSLKAGIRALPPSAEGALVVLADMPGITAADLDRLVEAFAKAGGRAIVRATHGGKRGNPVILPRAFFAEVERLEGDTGARQIVESAADVVDVELGPAASLDVDTPEALKAAGGMLDGRG